MRHRKVLAWKTEKWQKDSYVTSHSMQYFFFHIGCMFGSNISETVPSPNATDSDSHKQLSVQVSLHPSSNPLHPSKQDHPWGKNLELRCLMRIFPYICNYFNEM